MPTGGATTSAPPTGCSRRCPRSSTPARSRTCSSSASARGITVGTLARIGTVHRVAYDLNGGLREILARYGAETLHVATDPRVRLLWQDGRSGLALRPERYDLIPQQPLYLRQAGSSLLLSRESFRLVQRRVKPGRVFAIHTNALGIEAQAHLVRATAASVFAHCVSLGDQMAAFDAAARAAGRKSPFARIDGPYVATEGALVIRDDHPLVEYPGWATRLVAVPEGAVVAGE